ncbi:MAG TPA: hypothetical protein VNA13_01315, partial [Xanthomonadales bacterium]|nr:hypothetical protein [Xanthomonadales bacterium]
EYRKVMCANVALVPVYTNMRQAAEEEVTIIEQKRGVRIPGAIVDWFEVPEVPKELQKFL